MEIPGIRTIQDKIAAVFKAADGVMRGKAVSVMEYETEELAHIFSLLVLGMFVGIPSPPIHITMELLPDMEDAFGRMIEKVSTAHDPLGDLFSVLEID
ncbi:MAG: hypothetical protein LJE94_14990 [Deltaproteobacteria bacterium]|nr:hypothetical protein [Deltaproteobacteria bacterium]